MIDQRLMRREAEAQARNLYYRYGRTARVHVAGETWYVRTIADDMDPATTPLPAHAKLIYIFPEVPEYPALSSLGRNHPTPTRRTQ